MFLSKTILIYIVGGLLSLSIISSLINNIKDYFKEPTYTKEAVELMLKHQQLKLEIENLQKEIEIIEADNERIKSDISKDSTIIYNSSREYRDSLRAVIFAN